jgi:signal transduction histidine kinase
VEITVELEFDDNLPLVSIDREKIKQVILNLCKNAVEAMPDGGTLKCKAYQTAGGVILEVADTGTGIPEGLDVFQLFKTTKPHGTGLGLPIVGQIISEHRGTVDYVTELGKGTAFIVSLPLSATG